MVNKENVSSMQGIPKLNMLEHQNDLSIHADMGEGLMTNEDDVGLERDLWKDVSEMEF